MDNKELDTSAFPYVDGACIDAVTAYFDKDGNLYYHFIPIPLNIKLHLTKHDLVMLRGCESDKQKDVVCVKSEPFHMALWNAKQQAQQKLTHNDGTKP